MAISVAMAMAMSFARMAAILVLMFAVLRYINVVVPVILYEVDRCAAGAILAAMFAPILRMTTRDMQIHRLTNNLNGLNDYGLAVNQGRP